MAPSSLWSLLPSRLTAGAPGLVQAPRLSSILINPNGLPSLPSQKEAAEAASQANLDLDNIQSDILLGVKKKREILLFFSINDAQLFKEAMKILSLAITTVTQMLDVSQQPQTAINLGFSQTGLNTLGINDDLNDTVFSSGQFSDAENLGDPGTENWVDAFKGIGIHGLFILASDSATLIDAKIATLKLLFGNSITELYRLAAQARPGNEEGHERRILLGENSDSLTRPEWAKDGAFLAFRQLKQLVPEFNTFLANNPITGNNLTAQQGSDLLGARMMGRWKSGAPIDLAPLFDDPALGADPTRNNNFTFVHSDLPSGENRCPFSAHIRKTNPRTDLSSPVKAVNHIMRAGVPYGPEVSDEEASSGITTIERGLAFVAYQSNLAQGFRLIQTDWANNPEFTPGKNGSTPGFDPIIRANKGQNRLVSGLDPTDASHDFTLTIDFVRSRGGEYFFVPSISALKTVFSGSP